MLSSKMCIDVLKEKLLADGPDTFGAKLTFDCLDGGDGFDAPDLPEKMKACLNSAT